MASRPRVLAVIPARGGSKRVPGKNRRLFCGAPLISWSIRFAKAFDGFDRVMVTTDDPKIAEIAANEGLPVPFMRPPELSSDTASSTDVVRHALAFEASEGRTYDIVALLQPTSPVRERQRFQEALEMLADPVIEAVVGVKPTADHPYHAYSLDGSGLMSPFLPDGGRLRTLRSQDLPKAYVIAGNLYMVRKAVLEDKNTFFPASTAAIVCDEPWEALDIDTESDWTIAELLTRHFGKQPWEPSS